VLTHFFSKYATNLIENKFFKKDDKLAFREEVNLSLYQAVETHRVVRRRGSHIFYVVDLQIFIFVGCILMRYIIRVPLKYIWEVDLQMAVRLFDILHKVQLISYDVEEISLKHMKLLGLEDRMYYQYSLANL
jgi:hypothetical protein